MARARKTSESASGAQASSAEAIRSLAYQLYCENGCQDGHAMEHWLEAERRLQNRDASAQRKAA